MDRWQLLGQRAQRRFEPSPLRWRHGVYGQLALFLRWCARFEFLNDSLDRLMIRHGCHNGQSIVLCVRGNLRLGHQIFQHGD